MRHYLNLFLFLKIKICLLCIGCASLNSSKIENLNATLEEQRTKYELPSLAAAVFQGDRVVAAGAVGYRVKGKDDPVTIDDRFHIGSCTKSFTSTLVAILIEEGKLTWQTKIVDIFPELAGQIDSAYTLVTLEHLLSHTAGLPNLTDMSTWPIQNDDEQSSPAELRRDMVYDVLKHHKPIGLPGTVQEYSNRGYGIVSAIAERVTGDSWEALISKRIFKPLKLKSAGFGWPAKTNRPNQPWGHSVDGERLISHPPDTSYQIPSVLSAAGDIHMSVTDFAKWTGFQLKGFRGEETPILKKEYFESMHKSVMNGYALGWRVEHTSGGTEIHWHNGSGGTFYATMAFFPDMGLGVVAVANVGQSSRAVQSTVFLLANDFANRSEKTEEN